MPSPDTISFVALFLVGKFLGESVNPPELFPAGKL
jgi:hypothetical protein